MSFQDKDTRTNQIEKETRQRDFSRERLTLLLTVTLDMLLNGTEEELKAFRSTHKDASSFFDLMSDFMDGKGVT